MYANYQIMSDRIVLEYYVQGEFIGGERVDIPRNCTDLHTLAYNKADARATLRDMRLERLSEIKK